MRRDVNPTAPTGGAILQPKLYAVTQPEHATSSNMNAADETPPQRVAWTHWKNVILLALCQALYISTASLMIAIGGLVGQALADDKALSTLPVSAVFVGTALSTIPASLIMGRIGRRLGFIGGSLFGVTGSLVSFAGLQAGNFWIFSLGTFLVGSYGATSQLYRLAAVDNVPESFKSKAISLVLAGGVLAGFAGPQIGKWTKDVLPIEFLGSYLTITAMCVAAIGLQSFLNIPKPRRQSGGGDQRRLTTILRQPVFVVAVLSGMVGYGVMNLLMTATPLAMTHVGHAFDSAATVIQWHLMGMFVPSFFTGHLIARFGVLRVIVTGVLLGVGSITAGLTGETFVHYWAALLLLGVAWNFMFVGGSTLLTEAYAEAERPKTQAANEFLIFGTVALASLSSGTLLYYVGWQVVLWVSLPLLAAAGSGAMWLGLYRRRAAVAAAGDGA